MKSGIVVRAIRRDGVINPVQRSIRNGLKELHGDFRRRTPTTIRNTPVARSHAGAAAAAATASAGRLLSSPSSSSSLLLPPVSLSLSSTAPSLSPLTVQTPRPLSLSLPSAPHPHLSFFRSFHPVKQADVWQRSIASIAEERADVCWGRAGMCKEKLVENKSQPFIYL